MPSPWEAALGDGVERLPPELRAHCSALPPAGEGIGCGVFAVVGTPHRWPRPLLRLVGAPSIRPIRAHDVPFGLQNRADVPVIGRIDEHAGGFTDEVRTHRDQHSREDR